MTHAAAIRPATPDDAEEIARLHVAAWHETYPGLLPAAEIARRDVSDRRALWSRALSEGQRVALCPGAGFAQVAPQRELAMAARGFPVELWCLYTLATVHGTGLGRDLFRAALAMGPPGAFTCCVLVGNARALRFYARLGAERIETREDHVGHTGVTEHVLGWSEAARARI
ncbi:hypothetical protein LVO79_09635 [Roseivivax marinus]|uniref:GNAT family N-acetyltransferase n=1 Tax=Roseivivax marinus TaxID=1379903 RepID=UPI001F045BA9|nr:GNAT family N-acetyltransferase [Roseivivax marinus]UMA63330.1 hypothetical protein LVO79_09635 [Roseivivax marinus]